MRISSAARTTPAAASAPSQPTLKRGASGPSVKALQQALAGAGFSPGAADGQFGPKTEAAVKAFQKAKGLVADGIVGPKTWAKLTAAPSTPASSGGSGPTLKQGHSGAPVTALQNRLNQLGFNAGAADGQFGPKTTAAVKAFQTAKGLVADGVVGPKTWDKLGIKVSGTPSTPPSTGGVRGNSALANNARSVALSMGGYSSQGLCATGVSRAIQNTYGIKVWGNGNQIDNNLPRDKFKQVNLSLAEALKIPGLILTWEKTSTAAGSKYGHTAITSGDGRSSYSDFVERNTLGAGGRSGFKVFMPI
ncbi:peptidoglycan-binding domain-containing protein [Pyxidicoccus sp. MSG2]|uniref:peptidoglycan-binding domain-containing protein n=1 Tax=Pyxidicoccus sp. MSG2 TaxID=2996790 RepID=UPI00226F98C2|nr:peptidoglycan-binding protein [Pyxidicoccus sp. MSG2]MCY1015804.1 peptidoglycan-binding protein [Pyxidicoccus sp. MSG2]